MIEEKLLKDIDVVIKHKKKGEPTPNHPDLCSFFFRMASIGSSNTGKTYSICSYIKQYERYGVKDCEGEPMPVKTIWCSPTSFYSSNSIINTLKSLDEEDIYEDVNEQVLIDIFNSIKAEKEAVKAKEAYTKAYKRYLKTDPLKLTNAEIFTLTEHDFKSPKQVFGDLKNYMYIWVLDDVIGSANSVIGMKKGNFINNLTIKARHHQINLIFCVQQIKYLPPIVRNNLTIIQLFANASNKVLESYYDEVSNLLTYEEFLQLFEYCTKEKYGNLIINNSLNAKHRFMCGWNKGITINGKG